MTDWADRASYDGRAGHRFSDANPSGNSFDPNSNVQTDVTNKYIKRNLKPYKVLRQKKLHKNLKKLTTWSDRRVENVAVRAVLQKHNIKQRKLNRSFNKDRYSPQQIARAKSKVKAQPKSWKAQSKVGMHVQKVMQNRRIMKTNIWKGKGYDIRKGYI